MVLVLAGCGGNGDGDDPGDAPRTPQGTAGPASPEPPGPPPAAAGELDPCTLLTEDEVAAAVGAEVSRVEGPAAEYLGQQCEWFFPHPQAGEGVVTAWVWVGAEFYSPERDDDATIVEFEELPGIGDAAHRWPAVPSVCTVIYRKDDYVVQVTSNEVGGDVCLPLAEAAAGRT